MEKQTQIMEMEDQIEGVKPVIKVVRNTSMSAGCKVIELTIRKTWMIPSHKL